MPPAKKQIGFELRTVSHMIRRRIDEGANGMDGVTGMQGWMIGYLYEHANTEETFQRDLEREFRIRRSTVTGILQNMEKNGFIVRESVEYDARLKKLTLTIKFSLPMVLKST